MLLENHRLRSGSIVNVVFGVAAFEFSDNKLSFAYKKPFCIGVEFDALLQFSGLGATEYEQFQSSSRVRVVLLA